MTQDKLSINIEDVFGELVKRGYEQKRQEELGKHNARIDRKHKPAVDRRNKVGELTLDLIEELRSKGRFLRDGEVPGDLVTDYAVRIMEDMQRLYPFRSEQVMLKYFWSPKKVCRKIALAWIEGMIDLGVLARPSFTRDEDNMMRLFEAIRQPRKYEKKLKPVVNKKGHEVTTGVMDAYGVADTALVLRHEFGSIPPEGIRVVQRAVFDKLGDFIEYVDYAESIDACPIRGDRLTDNVITYVFRKDTSEPEEEVESEEDRELMIALLRGELDDV